MTKQTVKRRTDGTTHGLGRKWYAVRRVTIHAAELALRQAVYHRTGKRYGRRRLAAMMRDMGLSVSEETLRRADSIRREQ